MLVKVIVAISDVNGIGKDNCLPWRCKDDMLFFSRNTIGNGNNAVLMGKKTWLSLQNPLRNRMNIVVSTTLNDNIQGVTVERTIENAINTADSEGIDTLWVIGGASIYEWFLNYRKTDELVVSMIPGKYDCDTFFPSIDLNVWRENYRFVIGDVGVEIIYYKKLKCQDNYNLI
jgi:dihydrofolate reductase